MLRRALYRNFRAVYGLDQWLKRRVRPAGALVLAATMGGAVFGIDTHRSLGFNVFALGILLTVIAAVSAYSFRPRVRIRRALPSTATAGVEVRYSLFVTHVGSRRAGTERGLSLYDQLADRLPSFAEFTRPRVGVPEFGKRNWLDRYVGYPQWLWLVNRNRGAQCAEVALPDLPPDREVRVDARIEPARRGYLRFTACLVGRPDPFGLFRAIVKVAQPDALLVLPRRYDMPHIDLPGSRHYQHGGVSLAASVGDSQEFVALREYRPGDSRRHVHWKSWARLGKPVVKEFEDEFFVRQALVLDTFVGFEGSERFEEAVSVAASVALGVASQDALLDLVFIGHERHYVTTGRGVAQTQRILELLACVEACSQRPFRDLQQLVLEHAGRLSGCICVLLAWDQERREFIRVLRGLGVPLLVCVVTSSGEARDMVPDLVGDEHCRFQVLQAGNIPAGLAQLSRSGPLKAT